MKRISKGMGVIYSLGRKQLYLGEVEALDTVGAQIRPVKIVMRNKELVIKRYKRVKTVKGVDMTRDRSLEHLLSFGI